MGEAVTAYAGIDNTMVITTSGDLWAWGDNTFMQVTADINEDDVCFFTHQVIQRTPVGVMGNVIAASINSHSLAVTEDGNLWAWGANLSGQLGVGTTRGNSSRQIFRFFGRARTQYAWDRPILVLSMCNIDEPF